MSVRKSFDNSLTELKASIVQMAHLAEEALMHAFHALEKQDLQVAEQVIANDQQINELEDEIENAIVNMISTQQPVASDLRKIMSALKMTTSIERIGDFAVNISKSALRLGAAPDDNQLHDLPLMYTTVKKMLHVGMNAYMEEDIHLARDIAGMDDYVDRMYGRIVKKLLAEVTEDPEKMERAINLAYVARYLERVADHATNIAEAVYYIVEGQRVDLNQ